MRIALVGSAPSSFQLAPFGDQSWLVWGCSPGAFPHLTRLDAFFELHRWQPGLNGFDPPYMQWLAGLKCPVFMPEKRPEVPTSVAYPEKAILARYTGLEQSFFTSSLAWMLAAARDMIREERARTKKRGAHEVGLWGVDMAANDEFYGNQKAGCHFLILKLLEDGIKVTAPPESCILQPIPRYGLGENDPDRIKMAVRRREIEQRRADKAREAAQKDREYQQALREQAYLDGALDSQKYFENTWTGKWRP